MFSEILSVFQQLTSPPIEAFLGIHFRADYICRINNFGGTPYIETHEMDEQPQVRIAARFDERSRGKPGAAKFEI